MHLLRFVGAGASLALMAGLAGCAATPTTAAAAIAAPQDRSSAMVVHPDPAGEASLRSALADGKVTFDEYHAAMERFFACVRGLGFSIHDVEERKVSGVRQVVYQVQGGATLSEVMLQTCYSKTAESVDAYWQTSSPGALAFQNHREKALDGPLIACLQKSKISTKGLKSFAEAVVAAQRAAAPGGGCLNEIGYFTWQDPAS